MGRPDWDNYFFNITKLVAQRSTCLRRSVGALLVKNKRILATGYNGAPSGLEHCIDVGCMRQELNIPSGEKQEICRGTHAEQNALMQAAKFGISVEGSSVYVTHFPCITCSKLLINAGISEVKYINDYPDDLSRKMLENADIKVERLKV
ncbi:MAG: cytidine deaminase [Candidatus Mcinerneyibacterium aminivorans]|jgi:dCMP deaminase|uniref:Cytidine deaminase n=1 Tax=Candidatus Mcinerneyibacterium aminivorans TaxID=2703815 RepID=A0A5D0ML30_9BACT|nr:MAG: cytidine deaminase [Candidatus Mcinerneyibacterium aminivorans]